MALDTNNLEHDDKALELLQKWTDSLIEAVKYDQETVPLAFQITSVEQGLASFERSQESRKKHRKEQRDWFDYCEHLFRFNNKEEELRKLDEWRQYLDT